MSIKATFPTGVTELTVHGLHQWDYGQTLEIYADDLPANIEVHFACVGMTEAIVRKCTIVNGSAQALIPNPCLEQFAPLTAWVYEVGESSGETIKTITMPITQRAKPQTYTPPEEANEAADGAFLQASGGSWRPSENFKVVGKTLYLGNTALTEDRLQALLLLVPLPPITFLVSGRSYEAEAGTLWRDFYVDDGVACIQCRDGFAVYDEYGISGMCFYIVDENGARVLETDAIRDGGEYVIGSEV